MNGMCFWGVRRRDGTVTHVQADRLAINEGHLIFSEERAVEPCHEHGDAFVRHFVTMIFAAGEWQCAYAASVVDGSPLPIVEYEERVGTS